MDLQIEPETAQTLSTYEIERGKPLPNFIHGAIQANLIVELKVNFGIRYRIASEVDLSTPNGNDTPDIVIYAKRELNFTTDLGKQKEPPLTTIEIQSPSQSIEMMVGKTQQYFSFGVKSCWIVFPAIKGIAVYTNPDEYLFFHDDDMLTDSNLGIEIDLKKVFA